MPRVRSNKSSSCSSLVPVTPLTVCYLTNNSIGFHEVFDPGPPSAGYACPFYVDFDAKKGGDGCAASDTLSTPPQQQSPPPESMFGAAATGLGPASKTTALLEPTRDTAGITSTSPVTSVPAAESAAGSDGGGGGVADQGLSVGAKTAIAICSAVAIAALAALAFLLLRVRRRDRRRKSDGSHSSREDADGGSFVAGLRSAHIRHNRYANGGGGSSIDGASGTQRLVSHASTSTAASNLHSLAAPTLQQQLQQQQQQQPSSSSMSSRLWDRKRIALPAIFTRRSESPPLTPLGPASESGITLSPTRNQSAAADLHQQQNQSWQLAGGAYAFPSSPICTPTVNKMEPRHERTPSSNSKAQQQLTMIGQGANDVAMTPMDAKTAVDDDSSSTRGKMEAPLPPPPPPQPPHLATQRSQRSLSQPPNSRGGSVTLVTGGGTPSSLRNEFIMGSNNSSRPGTPGTPRHHPPPPMPPPTQPLPAPPAVTPPLNSPTRPPRPHETPLEIPGLLTAAASPISSSTAPSPRSPPPVSYHRVMPPAAAASPRRSPGRKASSSSLASSSANSPVLQQQQQQHSGRAQRVSGPAPAPLALRGFPRNSEGVEQMQLKMQMQAQAHAQAQAQAQAQLSGEARDLHELTREYAREQSAGQRPILAGVAPSPDALSARKGRRRGDSWPDNRRQEPDLEF